MEKFYVSDTKTPTKPRLHVLLPVIVAVCIGIFTAFCTLCLTALLLSKLEILAFVPVFALIAIAIGTATSAILVAKTFREDKLLMCTIVGIIWVIILVLLNIIFFREHMTSLSIVRFAIAIIVPICLSFCVGLNPRPKQHSGYKHKK